MRIAIYRETLPVMFGYLPLGMAFGVLFVAQLDYSWWYAPLMGIIIYAGAGQILAVSLIATGVGLLEVFVAMFVLNSRHLFYGLSLLGRFRGAGWRKLYLIFGLTDETYSLLTSRPRKGTLEEEQSNDFLITLLNQIYWVIGCAVGAMLGSNVAFDSTGIEFALLALFIVLSIEQHKALAEKFPLLVGALAATFSIALLPPAHQLIGAILLVIVSLLAHFRWKFSNSREQTHG